MPIKLPRPARDSKSSAKTFNDALGQLKKSLYRRTSKPCCKTTPMVQEYIAAAKKAQELRHARLAAAGAAIDSFQVAFSKLEDQMANKATELRKR